MGTEHLGEKMPHFGLGITRMPKEGKIRLPKSALQTSAGHLGQ